MKRGRALTYKSSRSRVPTPRMVEVMREVHRCCRVLGVPGFGYHVQVVLADRPLSGGALGTATSPWHVEHVGRTTTRTSRAGKPILRLHYARWRTLTKARRKYVVAHEVAHLVADLFGFAVHHHGKRWRSLFDRTQGARSA